MKAPLPEVPPYVPKKRDFAKAPSPSLNVICAVLAVMSVLALLLTPHDPTISPFWNWTIQVVISALSLVLAFYLWKGYGFARAIFLWITVLLLPFSFSSDETIQYSQVEEIFGNTGWAFSLFLLVYLNLPNVKAHFAQRKTVE